MRTYATQVRVGAEHIDTGGHANWLAQLKMAENAHFELRDRLGIGLEELKGHYGLFLVMGRIVQADYHRQLYLGDAIDVTVCVWIPRPTCLGFRCAFLLKDGTEASEFNWLMPLVRIKDSRVCRIPSWMQGAVGIEQPSSDIVVPA